MTIYIPISDDTHTPTVQLVLMADAAAAADAVQLDVRKAEITVASGRRCLNASSITALLDDTDGKFVFLKIDKSICDVLVLDRADVFGANTHKIKELHIGCEYVSLNDDCFYEMKFWASAFTGLTTLYFNAYGIHWRDNDFPGVCGFNSVFNRCNKLTTVKLGDNVDQIYDEAFSSCTSLIHVSAPAVRRIGVGAFKTCTALTEIKLLSRGVVLESAAFGNCTSLQQITTVDGAPFAPDQKDLYRLKQAIPFFGVPWTVTMSTLHGDQFTFNLNDDTNLDGVSSFWEFVETRIQVLKDIDWHIKLPDISDDTYTECVSVTHCNLGGRAARLLNHSPVSKYQLNDIHAVLRDLWIKGLLWETCDEPWVILYDYDPVDFDPNPDMEEWTVKETAEWATNLQFDQQPLLAHDVDGMLLSRLDKDDIAEALYTDPGVAERFYEAIQKAKQSDDDAEQSHKRRRTGGAAAPFTDMALGTAS